MGIGNLDYGVWEEENTRGFTFKKLNIHPI